MKTKTENNIWNWVIKDKIIEKGLSNPNEEYDVFIARLFELTCKKSYNQALKDFVEECEKKAITGDFIGYYIRTTTLKQIAKELGAKDEN